MNDDLIFENIVHTQNLLEASKLSLGTTQTDLAQMKADPKQMGGSSVEILNVLNNAISKKTNEIKEYKIKLESLVQKGKIILEESQDKEATVLVQPKGVLGKPIATHYRFFMQDGQLRWLEKR